MQLAAWAARWGHVLGAGVGGGREALRHAARNSHYR